MKKIMCLILGFLLSVMTGCQNNKETNRISKIGNYLYEYTLEDDSYWDNTADKTNDNTAKSTFGCSAVQNGIYRGRNYDWYYSESDLCVVHATKTEKRKHASVGISDFSFIAIDENGKYDISKLDYPSIPLATIDGINDAGVCIQVNVLPYGENFTDEATDFYHTPDTSDDLAGTDVVRYILDNADSVEHAIELLNEKDVTPSLGTEDEFHWMISGPTSKTDSTIKTVVVEFFPKKNEKCMKITDTFVENKPIMTNFNLCNFNEGYESTADKRLLTGIGSGYERWKVLKENYDQGNSVMGMFDLMRKAWDSQTYDLYGHEFWYSEYGAKGLKEYYKDQNELKRLVDEAMGEGAYDAQMSKYGDIYYSSALYGPEGRIDGDISKTGVLAPVVKAFDELHQANDMNNTLWITLETSIYDLENKTLTLSVRESRDLSTFTIAP
ncbi:MAG: hypothetical protein KBS62_02820 [Oscillospiraceae bacterium]|nr:hypothetical protein [Candidatus Ruminococcus equi]